MTVSANSIATAHINAEALRHRLGQALDEITSVLAVLDAIDDGADRIAEHARSCQVTASSARQHSDLISESAASAAGHIRRGEVAVRACRARLKRLTDVEQEARQGRY